MRRPSSAPGVGMPWGTSHGGGSRNVSDLESFRTFLGLCAGRAGQLLNLSALGADAGIAHVPGRT